MGGQPAIFPDAPLSLQDCQSASSASRQHANHPVSHLQSPSHTSLPCLSIPLSLVRIALDVTRRATTHLRPSVTPSRRLLHLNLSIFAPKACDDSLTATPTSYKHASIAIPIAIKPGVLRTFCATLFRCTFQGVVALQSEAR